MQHIGRNIFSLGLSRIISGIVIFIVYIQLVRYLGPDNFGKFSLVIAYYTIFILFVDLGISRYVIKKVSEDKSRASVYMGNFFIAQVFLSLLVFIAFLIIPMVFQYDNEIQRSMFLAGVGVVLFGISIPFAAVVQAWQKIHYVALVYFINTLINAGWLLFAILFQKDVVFLFWLYIIIGIVDIFLYAFVTRNITLPTFKPSRELLKKMFLFGVPFAFISGFEILIQKVDIVIQKFFLPFAEVGLYSAAYRFLDFLTFVPAVVAISLFPFFAEHVHLNIDSVKKVIQQYNRYMVILALPLGVGATLLADKIILTLFDQQYLGAVLPFQILIWVTVLTLMYAVPNVIMIVKRTRLAILILSFATIFNIVMNIIFVPRYGIIASAWITLATYIITAIWYIGASKKLVSYSLLSFAPMPFAGSVIMGIVLWLISALNVFILVVIALLIYFGFLIITGFIHREDVHFLLSLVKKQQS